MAKLFKDLKPGDKVKIIKSSAQGYDEYIGKTYKIINWWNNTIGDALVLPIPCVGDSTQNNSLWRKDEIELINNITLKEFLKQPR